MDLNNPIFGSIITVLGMAVASFFTYMQLRLRRPQIEAEAKKTEAEADSISSRALRELSADFAGMTKLVIQQQVKLNDYEATIKELRSETKGVQDAHRAEITRLQTEHEKRVQTSDQRYQELEDLLKKNEAQISDLETRLQTETKQRQELEQQLNEERQKNDAVKVELDTLREEFQLVKQERDALREQMNSGHQADEIKSDPSKETINHEVQS